MGSVGNSMNVSELHATLSLLLASTRQYENSQMKVAAVIIKSSKVKERLFFPECLKKKKVRMQYQGCEIKRPYSSIP